MTDNFYSAFSPAFVMEAHDRFHSILCSRPVCFNDRDKAEFILTFFFIRRANATYTICNINRTYDSRGKCVTRTVQGKESIPAERIEEEIENIRKAFTKGIEEGSGRKLKWDYLDLSDVESPEEQVKRIQEWGRVTAFADDGDTVSLQ